MFRNKGQIEIVIYAGTEFSGLVRTIVRLESLWTAGHELGSVSSVAPS
jgi:hypothetical protein